MGRWGYLDRFFHDLGGRESEPSGLQNAWIVEYRGQPKRLGRELAMALSIQEADYQRFGPIFDIEEIAGERRPRKGPGPPHRDAAGSPAAAEEGGSLRAATPAPAAPAAQAPQGPSWLVDSEVEDVSLAGGEGPGAAADAGAPASDSAGPAPAGLGETHTRWDDLFRIRSKRGPHGRARANAIAGASRRGPPGSPPPTQ